MAGRVVKRRSSSFRTIAWLTLLPIGGLILFFGYLFVRERMLPSIPKVRPEKKPVAVAPPPASALPQSQKSPATGGSAASSPAPKREAAILTRVKGPGDIVLIIDEVGFEGQNIERAMSLDPNVNFAILPNGTRTSEFAELIHGRGFEILCHLPMEPVDRHISPGRNAILTSMSDEQIAAATSENIAAVKYARGVNNHMGSRATADARVMRDVLRALPDGMYFIDSRTGGHSVALQTAKEMNVRSGARHVFLDDILTAAAVRRQLQILAAAAKARGTAIGIGHPHDVTLRVLAEEVPRLRDQGFRFVRASEAVR